NMQKLSRFKSKKFFIWGLIIMLVGYLSYKHRLEIAVFLSCRNAYAPTWSLDYVSVHNEDMQLVVSFNYRRFDNDPNRLKKIKNTYDSIKKHFFANPKSRYKDYTLSIRFMNVPYYFGLESISADLDKIEVLALLRPDNCVEVSLKELSEYFPHASRLHLSPAYYNDITEIDNFTNLEYIRFARDFTQEEYDYIKKKFPNCEIVE
ncbi:MAG: hypothetical protein ACOYIF_11535, partial [Acetivibrionales bacterium]